MQLDLGICLVLILFELVSQSFSRLYVPGFNLVVFLKLIQKLKLADKLVVILALDIWSLALFILSLELDVV
jgi:hypothetical protein